MKRKFIIIAISIFLIISTVFGTVILLSHLSAKKISIYQKINLILSGYDKITLELLDDKYEKQSGKSVYAKIDLANQKQPLNTSTKKSISFTAKNDQSVVDHKMIESKIDSIFDDYNLKKTDKSNTDFNVTNFQDKDIICQLKSNKNHLNHSVVCFNKNDLIDQYKQITELSKLSEFKNDLEKAGEVTFSKSIDETNNIAYVILGFKKSEKHMSLLFGYAENKWEYIGDLMRNNPKYAKDGTVFSDDFIQKIKQQKYRGFIEKTILN